MPATTPLKGQGFLRLGLTIPFQHRRRPFLGYTFFTVRIYENNFVVQIRIQILQTYNFVVRIQILQTYNFVVRIQIRKETKGNEENFVRYEGNFVILLLYFYKVFFALYSSLTNINLIDQNFLRFSLYQSYFQLRTYIAQRGKLWSTLRSISCITTKLPS